MVSKEERARRKALINEWKKKHDSRGEAKQKVKWLPTILLTLIFFAILEFVVYKIFGDIFQQWVWWFKLPAAAAEKQNPVLNIIVIVKILFGFAVLVLLPLGGSLILAEKILYRNKNE